MSSTSDQVLKKFKLVADIVKKDLKQRGIVIPTKNRDGTVSIENYSIVKNTNGFYSIKNRNGDTVVDNINLPQTAALIANSLALGKLTEQRFYRLDQEYGYMTFEVDLLRQHAVQSLKKKNLDRADFLYTKLNIAKIKVETSKASIMNSFEKLRNLH